MLIRHTVRATQGVQTVFFSLSAPATGKNMDLSEADTDPADWIDASLFPAGFELRFGDKFKQRVHLCL